MSIDIMLLLGWSLIGLPLGFVFGLWHFASLGHFVRKLFEQGSTGSVIGAVLLHLARFALLGLALWLALQWNVLLLPGAAIGLFVARQVMLRHGPAMLKEAA